MKIEATFETVNDIMEFCNLFDQRSGTKPAAEPAPAASAAVTPAAPDRAQQAPTVPAQAPLMPTQAPTVPAQAPAQTPAAPVTPQAPVHTPAAPAQAPQVPTSQKAYTLDELSAAAATLMDAGKQPELLALLQKYGVKGMFELPKEAYGAFATDLRGLGARI